MGLNPGDQQHNHSTPSHEDLTWDGTAMDEVPAITGAVFGGGLRGMEGNTNESKGTPVSVPHGTGPTMEYGMSGGMPDECS